MAEQQQLSTTDDELRAAIKAALDARDQTMASVQYAIVKALDAGRLLRAKKRELEHGEFLSWMEGAELGVGYEVCRRWMKLAEKAELEGDQIESAQSLRQAYTLTGLLPESETAGGTASSSGNSFLTFLTRSATHLQAQLSQRPLKEWPLEDRRVLRDRLKPLVEIYEVLTA